MLITDETTQANWPSYITSLDIVPGPDGANNATVSWTNPSTQADGDPLTDLDSTVILRNGEWVNTIQNPVIGGTEQIQVDVPESGLYVFTITTYNSEGASVPIYNDPPVWVGLDTPGPAENVILTVIDDTITNLNWAVPTVGAHGAYFDGVVSSYKIVRADGIESTVPGDMLTFTQVVDIPGTYDYNVTGINSSGEGEASESNAGAYYFDGYLLAEDFWVSVPALDWEKQGYGINEWYHWPTDYTGSPNYWEMIFHPNASWPFTGIARMVSPVLNSQDYEALTLKFRQYHNWNSGTYTFKIQTTSDGGTNWTDTWSIDVEGSIPGESELIVIDNDDVGSENFQFSFVFEGNSLNLQFLSLDDIWVFESVEIDMVATDLILPGLIEPNDIVSPMAAIENWGYLDTDFTTVMTFYEDNEPIYSSEISSNISGGGNMDLTFDDWTAVEGSYVAEFTVSAVGDTTPDNNTLTQNFDVLNLNAARTLVVCEEGTGTWCGYCPGAAMGLDDIVENNWPVAVIAYHTGDDYETVEGNERIDYYGISGFPTVQFDGVVAFVGGSGSESMYETYLPIVQNRLSIPAAASIIFQGMSITGNTMNVSVLIESGSPIASDDIVLHAALTESNISESWQGLDELNFVERTMYEGSAGTPIDLSDQVAEVTISLELDPAWISSNCELVVFVQNMDSKEIYNGNKVDLITVSIDETEKWVYVYPNPAKDYITISNCDKAIVNMYTIAGQKVLTENINTQNAQINVSQLELGMYIIELVVDDKKFTEKILINR